MAGLVIDAATASRVGHLHELGAVEGPRPAAAARLPRADARRDRGVVAPLAAVRVAARAEAGEPRGRDARDAMQPRELVGGGDGTRSNVTERRG